MKANNEKEDNNVIFVVIHHLNCLKYFDKLYDHLLKYNIECVYIFGNSDEMKDYCKNKKRKYSIVFLKKLNRLDRLLKPFLIYNFKKKIETLFNIYNPVFVIQNNDVTFYNDIIVKVARKLKIISSVIQWAASNPEEYHFREREKEIRKYLRNKKSYQIIVKNFIKKILTIIYYPLSHAFGIYSNYKLSIGQGDSDVVGVINEYSRNLFIKQGVNKKKVRVLGLLQFDDILESSKIKSKERLKDQFNIGIEERCIVFFSQPFYTKDVKYITLSDQLNYVTQLIDNIDEFYKHKDKRYKIIIKLHPSEDIKNYICFEKKEKIIITKDANINDLIIISDVCISQSSTVMFSVIIMGKPLISLNILGFEIIKVVAEEVIGIKRCINNWDEFISVMDFLEENGYSSLNNINYNRVIMDGNCYKRHIDIIKKYVNITKKRKNLL